MYNCYFRVNHFEKIKLFGDVVNSNIFARIFGYSTVHLKLKEFKGLELRKLKNLTFLNI
jgi:hypothetical protein